MKGKRIKISLYLMLFVFFFSFVYPVNAEASVITNRLNQVRKIYNHGSKFNTLFKLNYVYNGKTLSAGVGGCNGLVAFTTMKLFHNPYMLESDSYNKVGKTSSTTNAKAMQALFSKAKVGDVVVWSDSSGESHHLAIFLSSDTSGIYVYEANFGPKNQVWDHHLWRWQDMKSWAGGATKVNVFRSYNYSKVNKKKAAKNFKVGYKFEANGIKYKVVNNSINNGKVKVIGYSKKVYNKKPKSPKAISIHKNQVNYIKKNGAPISVYIKLDKYITYSKNQNFKAGEQFFKVVS